MTTSRATSGVMAAVVVAIAALTACAGPQGFSVFERDQEADDRLPREFVDVMALGDFDLSTSRFSASYHGVDFYVLRTSDGGLPCLAIAGDAPTGVVCGCDATTALDGFDVKLVREPARGDDEWQVISDNVLVRD